MAPEVDKTSPRRLDLMIFEPWIQESTKQWLSWTLNDPEYSFWDTRRIALRRWKVKVLLNKTMVFIYLRQEPPRSTMGAQRAPRSQQNPPGASMSCYNWCSGASQMNNSWKTMVLQYFSPIVKCYLVSTRAPLTKIDIKQRLHNLCSGASQIANSRKLLNYTKS